MVQLSRRSALAGLAAPLALTALPRLARAQAAPATQGAGFYRFRLGDMQAAVVSDGALAFEAPAAQVVAVGTPQTEVAGVLAEQFLPPDRVTFHLNVLYLDTGRNKVLIDAGSAASMGPSAGKLPGNLRAAGIDPAGIDTLIISHAHPDHLFGTLDPSGAPMFPNARYLIAETEHAFWTGPADLSRIAMPAEAKQGMIDGARQHLAVLKPRLELVQPGRELLPGITALDTPGHTPGHMSFLLDSAGKQLLVTYDVVHHFGTALPHPEWKMAFDSDPDLGVVTRKRLLDRIAADRLPMLAYHFPFPGLGHLGRSATAYGWDPVVWSWDPDAQLG